MSPQTPVSLWPDRRALGPVTDLYQLTMMAGYLATGMAGKRATFELFVRRLPPHRAYLVFAGLEQAIGDLLLLAFSPEQIEGIRRFPAFAGVDPAFFTMLGSLRFEGDVWAVPEGTVVFPGETLLRVTAPLPRRNGSRPSSWPRFPTRHSWHRRRRASSRRPGDEALSTSAPAAVTDLTPACSRPAPRTSPASTAPATSRPHGSWASPPRGPWPTPGSSRSTRKKRRSRPTPACSRVPRPCSSTPTTPSRAPARPRRSSPRSRRSGSTAATWRPFRGECATSSTSTIAARSRSWPRAISTRTRSPACWPRRPRSMASAWAPS